MTKTVRRLILAGGLGLLQTGVDPTVAQAPPPPGGAGRGAVKGAAGGAALGAVGGAIAGDAGKGAAIGAGTGALFGAAKGASQKKKAEAAAASAPTLTTGPSRPASRVGGTPSDEPAAGGSGAGPNGGT